MGVNSSVASEYLMGDRTGGHRGNRKKNGIFGTLAEISVPNILASFADNN